MDGILNLNKPAAMTSFDVVALVKHWSGEKRVGHAGTLDPAATGVLPVCLGKATRVTEFFLELSKTYRAEIELGITTDTGDGDGQVVQRKDISEVNLETLLTVLGQFRGRIQQIPPAFSALKYHGRPLYEYARAGISVDRKARTVEIQDVRLLSWESPVATIKVTCGHGTYIRSLADDIGKTLACGAYLKNLQRLSYGPFELGDSVSPSQLEKAIKKGDWSGLVHSLDSVLLHWPAIRLNAKTEQDFCHGRPLLAGEVANLNLAGEKARYRVYSLDGRFLGVLLFNFEESQWQPEKVFI
jgi:tRNA pseudouridine55 synthase